MEMQADGAPQHIDLDAVIGRLEDRPLIPHTSIAFVSGTSIANGAVASYGLRKRVEAVKRCRAIGKADMKFNDTMPRIKVDPERYTVEVDGTLCTAEPATTLPLTQAFFVF
ncbi:MAG: hypothetical protein M1826_007422 [Phylliscum demangeonii]|nr:MAG: hypothetical protein M1826_007422 [Phylliscum demangeonii]